MELFKVYWLKPCFPMLHNGCRFWFRLFRHKGGPIHFKTYGGLQLLIYQCNVLILVTTWVNFKSQRQIFFAILKDVLKKETPLNAPLSPRQDPPLRH